MVVRKMTGSWAYHPFKIIFKKTLKETHRANINISNPQTDYSIGHFKRHLTIELWFGMVR